MSEFFTSQTPTDINTILKYLDYADVAHMEPASFKFLEIGVFYGSTAKGVKDWADKNGVRLEYYGVDDFSHPNFKENLPDAVRVAPFPQVNDWPFDGANVINAPSWDVFMFFPMDLDIVFVDGNHSGNAVVLDTLLYSTRVRVGGYMMFHDTAPHVQGTMPEQSGLDHPWFKNFVLEAHKLMRWPFPNWKLVEDAYDPDAKFGGIQVFQRME